MLFRCGLAGLAGNYQQLNALQESLQPDPLHQRGIFRSAPQRPARLAGDVAVLPRDPGPEHRIRRGLQQIFLLQLLHFPTQGIKLLLQNFGRFGAQ